MAFRKPARPPIQPDRTHSESTVPAIDMAALEQVTVKQGPKEAKLLTDLDYGEDTAIQFVYNGPYMQAKDAFSLPLFT